MHQQVNRPSRTEPAPVIALHCSGAGAGQWRQLGEVLGPRYQLTAPEHYGCDRTGPWTGMHAFTLADEAARTIELIDRSARKVHLVGHSYGGGVALHAALARPGRVASLTLYEPSAFHLLKSHGRPGRGSICRDFGHRPGDRDGRFVRRLPPRRNRVRRLLERHRRMGSAPPVGAGRSHPLDAEGTPRLPRAHGRADPDHCICRVAHARPAHARRARTEAHPSSLPRRCPSCCRPHA